VAGISIRRVVLGLVFSGCLTLPGVGHLSLAESVCRLQEQQRRERELSRQFATCQRRTADLERITQGLCARRLALLEAAARLRDLADEEPAWPRCLLRLDFPADSDDECFCRIALAGVRDRLSTAPQPEGPAILERLEGELQQHRARGTLRLPGR
jgi:hypothetical protein